MDYTTLFIVLLATCLGGVIRFSIPIRADFPLNDGGMFYTMIGEIIDHRYALPAFTTYNRNSIPFFYPPLSFYLTAAVHNFSHLSILTLLQYLPAFLCTLIIPAFYKLSWSITQSQTQASFATIAFAFLPRSFVWLIMGGGLSRSLGFLFAILALDQIYNLFKRSSPLNLSGAILFSALTVLSHPEISWFLFCSAGFFGLWYGRNRLGIRHAVLVCAGVFLLILPWLLTVILKHGYHPLLSAFQVRNDTSFPLIQLIFFNYTEEAFTQVLGVLALLGIFGTLFRKQFLLSIWLVVIVSLSLRNAPYILMIFVALLAGIGLDQVVIPGLDQQVSIPRTTLKELLKSKVLQIFLGGLFIYTLLSAFSFVYLNNPSLEALSGDEREAMKWIEANTPASSQFAVITGKANWEIDSASEWFPALTGRISLATVQGTEWLQGKTYLETQQSYRLMQACTQKDAACLQSWEEQTEKRFSHIYLRKASSGRNDCCLLLKNELLDSPDLQLIYDGPGATIFTKK